MRPQDCAHENVPRYSDEVSDPSGVIFITEEMAAAEPLRMDWSPPRIVACPDCGTPVDRGRYTGYTSHPWARWS